MLTLMHEEVKLLKKLANYGSIITQKIEMFTGKYIPMFKQIQVVFAYLVTTNINKNDFTLKNYKFHHKLG